MAETLSDNLTDGPTPTKRPLFAGWVIVAFTLVAQFMSVGTAYYVFSTLLDPLATTLGVDRFAVSLALSLQTFVMAAASPKVGQLIADQPIRLIMTAGVVLMSTGLLLLGQVSELWQLYLCYGLIVGTGLSMTSNLPCNAMLANWFVRRRGMAMGLSQLGITISATVLVPLASWLIINYGWETAVTVFGIAIPAILLPAIWLFAIKTPEEKGLFPDGDDQQPIDPASDESPDWTMARALRDKRIWLLTFIFGPSFMAIAGVVMALPTHATDLGLSVMDGASLLAITTLCGALAKPVFGALSDMFSKRLVIGLSIGLQVAGIVLLCFAETYLSLAVGGILFGIGYGPSAPLWTIAIGALFDRQSFARVMGLMTPFTMPFNLVGLPFSTFVFGLTNSYVPAFAVLAAAFIGPAIALYLLRFPND